ncbi:MAG TPA: class I SAM-dependent methyltransferase [bacterium]|nr:class I SAM-dependent methyltransferase [bacterium]
MATYDFVKQTGRDKYWAMKEKEKSLMLDSKTGMLKKKFERWVKCPVCDVDDTSFAFTKDGFTFVRCNVCGMLYINPQLDEQKILDQYEKLESQLYWVDVLQTPAQLKYDTKKFRGALADIDTFSDPGKLLDVGCSLGIFLDLARKKGWDVTGVELNQRARKVAKKKFGLDLLDKPLNELDLEDESFDVVTLWEVLEHLTDPNSMLDECYRLLKPGGMLVILVPNCDSIAVRIMQDKAATFGWGHLWYFTPDSLCSILKRHGFVPFNVSTELGEMDTLENYFQFDDPYIGKNIKRCYKSPYILSGPIKKQLAEFVCAHNLGYKLRTYARKKK